MEIYFMRHGETDWNRKRLIQGSTAWTDLTDAGVHAAEAARDGLLAAGIAFDRLYSSPYRRAMHTAQIVGAGLGLVPTEDARIREISFGPYEGTRYSEGAFKDDNIRACFMDPPSYAARGGGESFDEVAQRVSDFLFSELAPLEGHAARVLAVAHGGVLRTVLRIATGLPLSDFWKGHQPNCCAHVLELVDGRLSLKAKAVTLATCGSLLA